MQMKRLGDTAVSPDGKWLAYSVTTVDLGRTPKRRSCGCRRLRRRRASPSSSRLAQPGDSGLQFAPDGQSDSLSLRSRRVAQQIWLADFDAATGATSNCAEADEPLRPRHDNAKWSPDGKSIVFTAAVYPDCPAIVDGGLRRRGQVQLRIATRRGRSKVKAQIWTHLLYRHWDHFTGDKRTICFWFRLTSGANARSESRATRTMCRRFRSRIELRVRLLAGLEGAGVYRESRSGSGHLDQRADLHARSDRSGGEAGEGVARRRAGISIRRIRRTGSIWRGGAQARAGYESDKFRLVVYDRAAKTVKDLLPNFDNWVDEFAWGPDSQARSYLR